MVLLLQTRRALAMALAPIAIRLGLDIRLTGCGLWTLREMRNARSYTTGTELGRTGVAESRGGRGDDRRRGRAAC
jgi:hypothetical protein